MNILFLHRSFPGQFKYIASKLTEDKNNNVVFITNNEQFEIEGIKKVVYSVKEHPSCETHPYLMSYSSAIEHGKASASEAQKLKEQGFVPDIIYGHSGWGLTMFMKDVFPEVPLICYFEWFQNASGADTGFGEVEIAECQKQGLRCANSPVLIDLYSCDGGISPTKWQKSQFPKEFQNKIKVFHDGIDTDFFKPNKTAEFLGFTANDEIVTYGTRGMEPYRGFPQFMKMVEKLLKKRPNVHVIIAGEDRICYRGEPGIKSYKSLMLEKLDIDLNRVHFVGGLSYVDYLKFLQISAAHIYLTVPFVLSWSILEAMSTECCVIASETKPVLEVIKDNNNGLLIDFFDTNKLLKQVEFTLDNKDKMQEIRQKARQTVLENYELNKLLEKQIDYLNSFIKKQ